MRGQWRFRKYVRVGRLIRLNLTRRSVSLSIGLRGLTLNLSARGIYVTLSAPGTGISYRIGAPWKHWLKNKSLRPTRWDEDNFEQGDEPWTR